MTANVCRISDVRCGAAALGSPSCGSPRGSISGSLLQAVAWAVGFIVAVLFLGPAASAGLIADWQFEGNVNDATGSYNATAVNSPTYAAGVIGQAFQPDGGATVPDMGATYTTVTVAAWIKTYDANSPGSQAIFHNTRWASGTPHFLLEYVGGSPSTSTTGRPHDVCAECRTLARTLIRSPTSTGLRKFMSATEWNFGLAPPKT